MTFRGLAILPSLIFCFGHSLWATGACSISGCCPSWLGPNATGPPFLQRFQFRIHFLLFSSPLQSIHECPAPASHIRPLRVLLGCGGCGGLRLLSGPPTPVFAAVPFSARLGLGRSCWLLRVKEWLLVARDIPAQLVASRNQDVTATKKVSQVSSKSSSALVRASRPPSS